MLIISRSIRDGAEEEVFTDPEGDGCFKSVR